MDETHIILLLAVLAVLVLAIAVVILLPKEKIAPSEEEQDKKASKKKGQNVFKTKPRTQSSLPAAVKTQRIKDFNEIEEAEDTRDLVDYFAKKETKPVLVKSEEKKKSKQPSAEARAPADKEEGEDYITIKREKKKAAKDNDKPSDENKKKKKKAFLKPEIVQAMWEGRKKDREDRKLEGSADQQQAAPKKKKDQKADESAPSEDTANVEEKKADRKEKKPKDEKDQQNQDNKKPRPPRNFNKDGSPSEQQQDQKPRPPPVKRTPPPIVNTGLEPASLDDMLSAITHYYAESPNIFKKLNSAALVDVLALLPLKDLVTLAEMNKFFSGIIKKDQKLWKALCLRDFGLTKMAPDSKSWKHSYKISYQQAHPRS